MLRSSKLLVISLWLSVLLAICYASISLTDQGVSVFFGYYEMKIPMIKKGSAEGEAFYIMLFTDVLARYWLGFFSMILAVISTCSIFPQFLQAGTIELSLSKPISRLRLFFLKYLGGLLFVFIQNLLFVGIIFIAVGVRLGEWNVSLFWAVPVIVFSFSLLFCVSALLGIYTKSSIYALLGTFVFWGTCIISQWAEDFSYKMAVMMPDMGMEIDFKTGGVKSHDVNDQQTQMMKFHKTMKKMNLMMPKTRETIHSMKRFMEFQNRKSLLAEYDLGSLLVGEKISPNEMNAVKNYNERFSNSYIFGSSAVFEAVILAMACFLFSRRDY